MICRIRHELPPRGEMNTTMDSVVWHVKNTDKPDLFGQVRSFPEGSGQPQEDGEGVALPHGYAHVLKKQRLGHVSQPAAGLGQTRQVLSAGGDSFFRRKHAMMAVGAAVVVVVVAVAVVVVVVVVLVAVGR